MAPNRPLDPASRLRLAREAKGVSVRHVADATKLSVRVVESVEGGRLSALPGGIYRRAIIRAVAQEAGLDADQLLRDFSAAYPVDLPAPEDLTAAVPAARRSFQGAIAFVGTILPLLAGVTYFGWPAARTTESNAVLVRPPVRAARVLRPEIVPVGGFTEATPARPRRPVVVTLTISSTCQLRIVADGREILGRTMEQGETLPIELGDELVLLGDNAAAVQFSINGQAGRMLGQAGGVLSVRIGRDDYQDFLVRH